MLKKIKIAALVSLIIQAVRVFKPGLLPDGIEDHAEEIFATVTVAAPAAAAYYVTEPAAGVAKLRVK